MRFFYTGDSRPLIERSRSNGSFLKQENLFRGGKRKGLKRRFCRVSAFGQSDTQKLGNQKYLLDYYLLDLFGSFYRCMLNDLWDQADTAGAQIYNLCLQPIRGEEATKETQIGQQVQAYVETRSICRISSVTFSPGIFRPAIPSCSFYWGGRVEKQT